MKLVGLSACVPKNAVDIEIAKQRFKPFDVDRIVKNTGVRHKREVEPGVTVSDLCIAAADPLLDALGWERDTVDAVIVVTTLSDYIMPACAHRVQQKLGLGPRCLVFDINLGCSGFTHGLMVIDSLIATGLVRRALLLCGEMTTDTFRKRLADVEHRSDLGTAILFGDAGTAAALTVDPEGAPSQIRAVEYGADGSGMGSIIVPGGAGAMWWSPALFERVEPAKAETAEQAEPTEDSEQAEAGEARRPIDLVLEGPQVLTFTMKRVPPLMQALLDKSGWEREDIDAYVLHQANKFMLDFLVRRMKVPKDRVPMCIEEFGNTSSASIPLTMVTRCGQQLAGPTKWALLGFGVGLSWSGVLMETDGVTTLPLIEI